MAMDRLAVLGIVVDPQKAISGAKKASNAIKKVGVSARKSKRDISVLQSALPAMARMAVASARKASMAIKGVGRSALNLKDKIFSLQGALIALGGGLVAKSFISTASSMENLKIQLKTVTGSVADADEAFARLTDFTTRTPYEIDQVVEAFTKLKAFGLDPSEEAMTAFGNTSAAMGKDLNQMIEAVADAATGEFERLREFGIKAKQQGDEVSLTFQGVTKTIKKDSEAIQGYLMDIGNNQFGGAMSDQMETMSGAVSNFRGSWTLFQDELMASGPFDILKGLINATSDSLFGKKGSLSANAQSAGKAVYEFIRDTTIGLARFVDDTRGYVKAVWGAVKSLWDTFKSMPAEVQSVGIVGVFLGGYKLKLFMVGILSSIKTIKGLLGMSNIDNGMLNDAEALHKELGRVNLDLMALSEANLTGSPLADKLGAQSALLVEAIEALESGTALDLKVKGTGDIKDLVIGASEISKGMGDAEANAVKFYKAIEEGNKILNPKDVSQGDVAFVDLTETPKEVNTYMDTVSAHRNAQKEMLRTSTVFEERNAELHAAAMARKTTSFNVFKDHFNSGWQEMEQASTPVLEQMADKLVSIFGPNGTFSKGIGDATANMIVFGKSGSDSMKALGQAIMQQVISALVSMGVQTALNFAKEKIFATSSTALGVAQAAVTATAWAPAAAAVSLATFGGNAVGANIGMSSSFALAKGLSSFEGGGFTGSGSRSGGVDGKGGFHAILHPNETVIDHTKSKNKSGNGKSSTVVVQQGNTANVTFTINAVDTAGATRVINEQRGTIISVINQALNERGRPALV